MNHWSDPEILTCTGASHVRRGVVCQDASGRQSLLDRGGQPVHVMVVADGHGGERYIQSDIGSRLACEIALKIVAAQFSQWSSKQASDNQRWLQWLEETFPQGLHQEWMNAVRKHWKQANSEQQAHEEEIFVPVAYGTTIGVVIMTPTWWGHTGLGDWDLVRVDSTGDVALVSEEEDDGKTVGEATYSLCMSNASAHFAARTAVYPIAEQSQSFSLLLSTDGVRKSCRTDEDFLTVAKYLCEGEKPRVREAAKELNSDLDRISSKGSGDDVSVAIGRWHGIEKSMAKRGIANLHRRLQRSRPVVIQPPGVSAGGGLRATKTMSKSLLGEDTAGLATTTNTVRLRKALLFSGGLVIISATCLVALSLSKRVPNVGADNGNGMYEHTPELVAVLRKEIDSLCSQPRDQDQLTGLAKVEENMLQAGETEALDYPENNNWISIPTNKEINNSINAADDLSIKDYATASLVQRKSIFKSISKEPQKSNNYLSNPSQDPIGTLIAWSFVNPTLETITNTSHTETGLFSGLSRVIPGLTTWSNREASEDSPVVFCRDLRLALENQWQQAELVKPSESPGLLVDALPAKTSIQELYRALSKKNFDEANQFYGTGAKDQFNPIFFRQFAKVTAQNLKVIRISETTIDLIGDVSLIWPDKSMQVESRFYRVDVGSEPAVIIESEYRRMISSRRPPENNFKSSENH